MSTETDMPPELTETPQAKRPPGRPRKSPSQDQQEEDLLPLPEMGKAPPTQFRTGTIHSDHFKFAHVGMMVWWWDAGERENAPYPAMVTAKHKDAKSLGLTVFMPGAMNKHQAIHRIEESVRHIEDPSYIGDDRKSVGAWELTPSNKALYDLVEDARRNDRSV